MMRRLYSATKSLFTGDVDFNPTTVTVVLTAVVTALAAVLAISLYETVGVHYPGVWYQLFATLVIASILAPIFLYPIFKTSMRLRQAKAFIEEQATTDHLTSLPNMFAFTDHLDAMLKDIGNAGGFAVHFIDLDRFKQVNDSLGHDAGNMLLVEASNRLRGWVGPSDFVARFGGDEFVVIQNAVSDEETATRFAHEMRRTISAGYYVYEQEVSVGATIGTALVPRHGTSQAEVLKAADLALYEAKTAGRASHVFEPRLAAKALARRNVESVLRSAVKERSLKPYFHSIVRMDNPLHIVGFEALARIELSDGDVLNPAGFIPVAESTGMIFELGEHMLKQACIECTKWRSDLYVAVNVSPIQLLRSDFLGTVRTALDESGLPAGRLELEITESVLVNDIAETGPILNRLREMGVRIALDDFGSGFCGLHYLRAIAIDKIKVDKSIIDDAETVPVAANILKSVLQLAKDMGLTVTVEGVDSLGKARFLATECCADELQGFLFSRPAPADTAFRMQEFIGQTSPGSKVVTLSDYMPEQKSG